MAKKSKSKKASSKKSAADEEKKAASAAKAARKSSKSITNSSTAEYFSKNLQQVGFSSPTKAVLTTLKEAMDNSLDACEDHGILPEIKIEIEKIGSGSMRNTDQIRILVEDNGPGLDPADVPKVFGEYLASSKFGRGRCSRGQQGIGISAATTWAMQTSASGAQVVTKKAKQKKAFACTVNMDLKNNRGLIQDKKSVDWDKKQGTSVEFLLDGRIQMKGDAGLLTYLRGNVLVNPHLKLSYKIGDDKPVTIERVSQDCPKVPDSTEPHPHTMKLGEFMSHGLLFGRTRTKVWLKKGFSRMGDKVIADAAKEAKLPKAVLDKYVDSLTDEEFKLLFKAIQNAKLMAPSTSSVLSVGEDGLALSIRRLGDVDFFAVTSRKPTIADFKPVQVEMAIARLRERSGDMSDTPVQVLRFANRVPLQFDKAGCAIAKAITSVNWRSYGLRQPKNSLPVGPFIIAVSVVSPFIKFKNASKETIDASDELVEELRRGLMQAGQRLSRYLKREQKAGDLEQKVQHIEQFGPILVETLARIIGAPEKRKVAAEEGLARILERDTKGIKSQLKAADDKLTDYLDKKKERLSGFFERIEEEKERERQESIEAARAEAEAAGKEAEGDEDSDKKPVKKSGAKAAAAKKTSSKKKTSAKKKTAAKKKSAKKAKAAPAKKKTASKAKKKTAAKTKSKTSKKAKATKSAKKKTAKKKKK